VNDVDALLAETERMIGDLAKGPKPRVELALRISGDLTATLVFTVDGEMQDAGRSHRDLVDAWLTGYGAKDREAQA
jgi:hypothetical protein